MLVKLANEYHTLDGTGSHHLYPHPAGRSSGGGTAGTAGRTSEG